MVVIPFASLWMMLRLSQAAVLVTMFFFVPVVARMPTYEPVAWVPSGHDVQPNPSVQRLKVHHALHSRGKKSFLFGDAPTDSERKSIIPSSPAIACRFFRYLNLCDSQMLWISSANMDFRTKTGKDFNPSRRIISLHTHVFATSPQRNSNANPTPYLDRRPRC
jgi:hypothetical protein